MRGHRGCCRQHTGAWTPAARGMWPGIFIAVQPRVVAAKGGTSMLSSYCPWDTRIVSTLWCDSRADTEPPGIRYVATTLHFTSVSTRRRRLKFPLVRERELYLKALRWREGTESEPPECYVHLHRFFVIYASWVALHLSAFTLVHAA